MRYYLIVIAATAMVSLLPVSQADEVKSKMADARDIQEAYVSYYGRAADTEGLDYWTNQVEEANGDLNGVIQHFGYSEEYTERFAGLSNEKLINNIFNRLFDRDAQQEGLDWYTEQLEQGNATLQTIALNVADGARGSDVDVMGDKVDAAMAFTETLRKTGESLDKTGMETAKAVVSEANGEMFEAGQKHYDFSVANGQSASVSEKLKITPDEIGQQAALMLQDTDALIDGDLDVDMKGDKEAPAFIYKDGMKIRGDSSESTDTYHVGGFEGSGKVRVEFEEGAEYLSVSRLEKSNDPDGSIDFTTYEFDGVSEVVVPYEEGDALRVVGFGGVFSGESAGGQYQVSITDVDPSTASSDVIYSEENGYGDYRESANSVGTEPFTIPYESHYETLGSDILF